MGDEVVQHEINLIFRERNASLLGNTLRRALTCDFAFDITQVYPNTTLGTPYVFCSPPRFTQSAFPHFDAARIKTHLLDEAIGTC